MSASARRYELEAQESASAVLQGYRASSSSWAFTFDSPFWLALKHGHHLGYRGADRPIAIIDSDCDDLQVLRQRVQTRRSYVPAARAGAKAHGSAVALLIAEAAPDCRLHIHSVVRDDGVDPHALRAAVEEAAESGAAIINLSIGSPRPLNVSATARGVLAALQRGEDANEWLSEAIAEKPACELCGTARSAAARKIVFAAVGNSGDEIYCPSCADGVIAVGFQGVRRERVPVPGGGWTEKAVGTGPDAAQAIAFDLTVQQIDGVLGSSFACPLHAGAAALGVAAAELKCYIASIKQGWLAQLIHASLKRGAEPALVQAARRSYQAAVQALPHVHDDVLASLRGGDQVADPAKCFACGIYSEPLIVNYGLFLGETGRPDLASRVLEAATVLAPWDAHAAANLGAAYRHLGQRAAAAEQYRRALSLRPGFEGYQHALNELS